MSFLRHEEIYRPMSSVPGRPDRDRPRPHRFDEFPAGYSLVGCAPALPASASPAEAHREAVRSGCTIEKQRTVGSVLTVCLTRGDNHTQRPTHPLFSFRFLVHRVCETPSFYDPICS